MVRSSWKWCQSFALLLCWFLLSFFPFMPLPFPTQGPKPLIMKIWNSQIEAKMVSIVCAVGRYLFSFVLLPLPTGEGGNQLGKFQNRPIEVKMCQSIELRLNRLCRQMVSFFFVCASSPPHPLGKNHLYIRYTWCGYKYCLKCCNVKFCATKSGNSV